MSATDHSAGSVVAASIAGEPDRSWKSPATPSWNRGSACEECASRPVAVVNADARVDAPPPDAAFVGRIGAIGAILPELCRFQTRRDRAHANVRAMKSRTPFLRLAAAIAIALATGACSAPDRVAEDAVPPDTSAPAASSPSRGGSGGDAATAGSGMIQPADAPALLAAMREGGAPVTLVNVWATWCAPCREEFPDLVRLSERWRDRGLRVMFVSADFDDQVPAVRAFLARHGVTQPSWIKTGDDMTFINTLSPGWSGALPATFIYDADGQLVRFWEGLADSARFESEVRAAMAGTPTTS